MQKITIGFSKPKKPNPVSWLIMRVNRTPFSHTYVKINSSSLDRDLIYQARGTQVNFIGLKRFDSSAIVVKEFDLEVTQEQKTLILQFCVDNAGVPYGVMQLVGMLYVMFMRTFKRKVRNPWTSGMVCVEVIVLLIKLLNIPIDADPDTADLNDVNSAIESFVAKLKTTIPEIR